MTINLHDLKPGQTLWYMARELTIKRLDDQYVFFHGPGRDRREDRIPLDSIQVAIHETRHANQRAWDALRSVFATQYTIPLDVDLRDVADAAEALGITEQFRREIGRK